VKQNFDKTINEYVDKNFEKEKRDYKIKIKKHLKEGLTFKRSFKHIENEIQQKIDQLESDVSYKYLKEQFQNIGEGYQFNEYNNTANSEEFSNELALKNLDIFTFLEKHKKYLVVDELKRFHKQNKAIFERFFKIKYDDRLKYKVDYEDLVLCKGNPKNDGETIDQWNRLEEILNPPKKKNIKLKLQKYSTDLSTKDIAVFMILFKSYYKLSFSSYVEFVNLSRLIFDDLHYNFKSGDAKMGTSIKRYIKGEDLFAGNFKYEQAKNKILKVLSEINLKDFKKYIEITEIDKFKKLIR
jgi:hypothetical protein